MSPRVLYCIFEMLKKRQKQKNNIHGYCFSTFTTFACNAKKLCTSHCFSLFLSSWCFWTNWQKLLSNLSPIAALSVCSQNRSYYVICCVFSSMSFRVK